MKISEDIQQQIDFLKREETIWVKRAPAFCHVNEACAVERIVPTDNDRSVRTALQASSVIFLNDRVKSVFDLGIVRWNDSPHGAESKEDVIKKLIEARDKAIEQGK